MHHPIKTVETKGHEESQWNWSWQSDLGIQELAIEGKGLTDCIEKTANPSDRNFYYFANIIFIVSDNFDHHFKVKEPGILLISSS